MIEKISEIWASQNLSIRTIEHLAMFSIAMILSILIGISIGILIYKRKRLANFVINLLNVIELIPTIALLIILLPFLGLGSYPTIAACVLYSLLPIARNTYTGLTNVNKEYIEVSKGMGFSQIEVLTKIRIPMAFPLIIGGIRIAIVFTMGVVTLGGLITAGGLGASIQTGISLYKIDLIIVSGIWVGVLAVIFDGFAGFFEYILKRRY